MPYSIALYWFIGTWVALAALLAAPASAATCTTGSETRVIAFETTGGACPAVNSFVAGPLFPVGAPAPLSGFCLYTSNNRGWGHFQTHAPGTLADAALDCLVTMPQQLSPAPSTDLALAEAMAPELATRFEADVQAGAASRARVRVEVLDTLPAHEPLDARAAHGPGMVAIARLAAGVSEPIEARLALGRVSPGIVDPVRGGHVGTVGDLARALYDAVDGKRADEALIINLSLGWEPGVLGGLPDVDAGTSALALDPHHHGETGLAGPVRAAHAALGLAACANTLVVAAAGNTEAGVDGGQGALLPAAWQDLDVQCGRGAPGPMVLAAGGIDRNDAPIANARQNAEPALVLVAEDAVVALDDGFTWPMTGTSVASALLSGIATRVWSDHPDDDRNAVIGRLLSMGRPLGRPASLCLSGGCPVVKRIDVCHATGRCGAVPRPDVARLFGLIDAVARDVAAVSVSGDLRPSNAPSDPSLLAGVAVGPQPGTPVCPSCPARIFGHQMVAWVTLGLPVTSPRIVAVDLFNQPIKAMPLPSAVNVGKLSTVFITGLPAGAVRYRIEGKYNGVWHSSVLKTY